MPERDPKLDPRPGDVLSDAAGWTRRVELITARVRYVSNQGKHYSMRLDSWRKWAATAEVIAKGPDA